MFDKEGIIEQFEHLLVNTSRQLMLILGFTKVPPSRSDPGDAAAQLAAPRPRSLPHLRSGRKMVPEPEKWGCTLW